MKSNERGIALVLALFLMTALSILGASLMFLSQTETYASMNYRMMSQSRYAAEAGIHSVANYLLDQTKYALPNTALNPSDPITGIYDLTKSPVTLIANNQPIVLSWDTTKSNYPRASVVTAFAAASQGTLTAGTQGLSFKTTATLLTMQEFDSFDGTPSTIQTWSLVSDGGLANSTRVTDASRGPREGPVAATARRGGSSTIAALYFGKKVFRDAMNSFCACSACCVATVFRAIASTCSWDFPSASRASVRAWLPATNFATSASVAGVGLIWAAASSETVTPLAAASAVTTTSRIQRPAISVSKAYRLLS